MWRLNACERLIEPLPRTRKRFFAPDFVFIFGMMPFPFMRPAGPSQGSNYAPWGAAQRPHWSLRPQAWGQLFAAYGGALGRLGGGGRDFFALRLTVLRLVRVMRFRERLFRRQQHHHLPAFHSRERFDDAVRLQIVPHPFEQTHAELLVRHLAAAKTQRNLRFV